MLENDNSTPPALCTPEVAAAEILEEISRFIGCTANQTRFGARSWLGDEDRGVRIYVGTGPRFLSQALGHHQMVTLANISVHPTLQGRGLFTHLLNALKQDVPARGYGLYVESIVSPKFAGFLTRQGFKPRTHAEFDQYWLPQELGQGHPARRESGGQDSDE